MEQQQLDLEWPVYDHYTIELSKGPAHGMEVVRTSKATDVDGAIGLIEGLRDLAASRDDVTWRSDEVDGEGLLYGLAPGGEVWLIKCFPPLNVELA